ncbi:hypothetical protein G6F60_015389 [Rhizopus arrhizus]|nr:hypothetical protein G6F60_015389 [Rhizopus arrhizus]
MIGFSRNGAVIADGEGVCRPAVAAIAAGRHAHGQADGFAERHLRTALQPTGRLVQQAGQLGLADRTDLLAARFAVLEHDQSGRAPG